MSAYMHTHVANKSYLGISTVETKTAAATALLRVTHWTKTNFARWFTVTVMQCEPIIKSYLQVALLSWDGPR